MIEGNEALRDLWVGGEISNFSRAASGHLYFTLKDSTTQMACVMWRPQAARLAVMPREGMQVVLRGYVTVYESRGVYQFYANELITAGAGLLAAQFEELKARLQAEGLFDAEHKRVLPVLPQRIGVVTSESGAVLHDIVNILRRRYPIAELVLAPSAVQGADAAAQLVEALQRLQALGDVDVIIVARGGGSLEDLWAFNDEGLARAIYACSVPVISAVGHEVDFTIADFVADVRAPTPSAAAELVAPDLAGIAEDIAAWRQRLVDLERMYIDQARSALKAEERALARVSPRFLLDQQRQRVDDLWQRARSAVDHDLALQRERAHGVALRLHALSPLAVLDRGFAIVWRGGEREVVAHVVQVQPGDRLQIQVSDGHFPAVAGNDGKPRQRNAAKSEDVQLSLDL